MAISIGLGDGLALFQICKFLVAIVTGFKHAPVEYHASVQYVYSLHAALVCIAKPIEEFSTKCSTTNRSEHNCSDLYLIREIDLAKKSLKRAKDILLKRYASHANSSYPANFMPRLRWIGTKSKLDASIRLVQQHLLCAYSFRETISMYA